MTVMEGGLCCLRVEDHWENVRQVEKTPSQCLKLKEVTESDRLTQRGAEFLSHGGERQGGGAARLDWVQTFWQAAGDGEGEGEESRSTVRYLSLSIDGFS